MSPLTNTQAQQQLAGASGGTPSGLDLAPSQFYNVPQWALDDPSTVPSAWGISDPSAVLYAGSPQGPMPARQTNVARGTKNGDLSRTNDLVNLLKDLEAGYIGASNVSMETLTDVARNAGISDAGDAANALHQPDVLDPNSFEPGQLDAVKRTVIASIKNHLSAYGIAVPDGANSQQIQQAAASPQMITKMQNEGFHFTLHRGAQLTVNDVLTQMAQQSQGMDQFGSPGAHGLVAADGNLPDSTASITDTVKGLYTLNAEQLNTLQHQLYDGHMYQDAVYQDPTAKVTFGHLDSYTMQAFGNLLTQAASAYKKGQKVTWTDLLNQQIQAVQQMGGPDILGAAKKTPLTLATPGQLTSTLQTAAERLLGRVPTQAELAQFTASYQGKQQAHAGQIDPSTATGLSPDFTTGVQMVPGVGKPADEAVPFLQGQDQTEYLGHQMANSYAMFLNTLGVGRTMTTELPGFDPNRTSASSAL